MSLPLLCPEVVEIKNQLRWVFCRCSHCYPLQHTRLRTCRRCRRVSKPWVQSHRRCHYLLIPVKSLPRCRRFPPYAVLIYLCSIRTWTQLSSTVLRSLSWSCRLPVNTKRIVFVSLSRDDQAYRTRDLEHTLPIQYRCLYFCWWPLPTDTNCHGSRLDKFVETEISTYVCSSFQTLNLNLQSRFIRHCVSFWWTRVGVHFITRLLYCTARVMKLCFDDELHHWKFWWIWTDMRSNTGRLRATLVFQHADEFDLLRLPTMSAERVRQQRWISEYEAYLMVSYRRKCRGEAGVRCVLTISWMVGWILPPAKIALECQNATSVSLLTRCSNNPPSTLRFCCLSLFPHPQVRCWT